MKSNDYEVELINIHKSFDGDEIFGNLNLSFIKNKISIILGPSGCGKTTLLNIISKMEKIDSGKVILKDKSISYVFQEDRLIPWLTVYENIAFVLKSQIDSNKIESKVNEYLNMVNLKEYKDKLPNKLSGGMKRRVALARAFAYKSELLLMDEPFKGLDFKLKNKIIKEFLKIWSNDKRTVIMVTHDMKEANMLGDKIYDLEEIKKYNY